MTSRATATEPLRQTRAAAKSRVGIIGQGHVGTALSHGLSRAGYAVRTTGRKPAEVRDVASWGDIVILAVPFSELDATVREMGDAIDGKTVVDVTNTLNQKHELALNLSTSGAEELRHKLPRAKVVKAFNTVFAENMETGSVDGSSLSLLAAGNDGPAKHSVLELGRDLGFDPVDAGTLHNARWLETLGYLNIQLGYGQKMGTHIGFKLVH
ncbi:MAG TPA: NAD(P)-binding domain-containing protein [Gemmatimonadales bacterium]|jgi:hypothetical protein